MTPQEIYEYILHSNLINFLIMVYLLALIFKKFKLGNILDKISYEIINNVETSANAVQKALSEYKEAKRESRTVNQKTDKIISDAKEKIEKFKEKNAVEIKEKEELLEKNVEKQEDAYLDRRIQKTTNEIKCAISKLSVETIKSMLNEELHKKIIVDAMDELDSIGEVEIRW